MVESTALEMRHTGNRIVGSNPTLSAMVMNSSPVTFKLIRSFDRFWPEPNDKDPPDQSDKWWTSL